jgi:hypothetical protein
MNRRHLLLGLLGAPLVAKAMVAAPKFELKGISTGQWPGCTDLRRFRAALESLKRTHITATELMARERHWADHMRAVRRRHDKQIIEAMLAC